MNSFQESKNELEAAIRYAENAISAAQSTIESMEFRQEMAKKQHSEQTGREQALEREVAELKAEVDKLRLDKVCAPTMPVIPKAVAIAIFREGMAYGACRVCDEIENAPEICIEENEYCGGFEVSFTKDVDLSDELDLDYLRESTSVYDESSVIDALYTLCADNKFECRIHGIDSND